MSGVGGSATLARSDVELAAEGDESAFARLVAGHHAQMTRVAYVITGDQALAQDAVQAAWLAAWRGLASVRDPRKIRPWLLRIAVNEARQISRRRRQARVVELDPRLEAAGRADPAVGISRLDLVRVLDGLSADDRALLALRYVAGIDASELGALTGRSASGTRTRLTRLKAHLRQELGDD